jgi:hypothetical protein
MVSKELLPTITDKTGSVVLMGGLGNLMFQMAALLSDAKDNLNFDPVLGYWLTHQSEYSGRSKVMDCNTRNHHFDPWGGHTLKDRGITLGDIFPKLPWFYGRPPAFQWDINQRLTWDFDTGQGGEYIPIRDIASPPFLIQGYFFNHLYWHHNRSYLLDMFTPNNELLNYLQLNYSNLYKDQTISLHLRLGNDNDFIQPVVPPIEWYKSILNKIRYGHHILVFTDNQDRGKELLDILDIPKSDVTFVDEDPHTSMFMMARCDKHILSNSTLSFWGAYLDNKQENNDTYLHESFFEYHPKEMIPYQNWQIN